METAHLSVISCGKPQSFFSKRWINRDIENNIIGVSFILNMVIIDHKSNFVELLNYDV
jgi:hypothetical protein